MNYRFSPYGRSATSPSPVNSMMADFAQDFRDAIDINLGVGYVNEATIPVAKICDAMTEVSSHPGVYRQAFNYGGPQGSPNLIQSLRHFYLSNGIGNISEEVLAQKEILIGPSGATSILAALADIFEPGIVITADPMYYIYCDYLERKGFQVLTVPEDDEGISVTALEEQLKALGATVRNLSFFYIVTVNNPSGVILSNTRKRALVEMARYWSALTGHAIPLFFDQAYEWLIHDPAVEKPESAMMMDKSGLVYEIATLSKILAPALRIGFMVGPSGPFMDAVAQKTSDIGFSAPLTNQEIAAALLRGGMAEQLARVNAGYREKAKKIEASLTQLLAPWLRKIRGGKGGFYFYLDLKGIRTDRRSPFFHFLSRTTGDPEIDGLKDNLNRRVIYIPGEFCVHPQGSQTEEGRYQLRLSYGYEDTERIIEALHIMREAIVYAESQGE
ncbi:MAG: aminotransferase class I/II-fold pyridoxal phosphate-dependent enzyme [Candidatus Hydrogenedentales bacterium]|jgi:DNA-binding transcriptional MocR family regulator